MLHLTELTEKGVTEGKRHYDESNHFLSCSVSQECLWVVLGSGKNKLGYSKCALRGTLVVLLI